jgi:hypothetical protein
LESFFIWSFMDHSKNYFKNNYSISFLKLFLFPSNFLNKNLPPFLITRSIL